MKKVSLVMIVGLMLSVCQGQTLESLRGVYSNDLSRIESKKAEAMKAALSDYSLGLDKVRDEYVKGVNFKGIKAVDEIKNEIFNGNIKLDANFPEILDAVKKYKDSEAVADKGVETAKKVLLEKYRSALKGLCAAYLKSDMAKAEKVSNEIEMVESLLKEYSSKEPVVVSDVTKKTSIPSGAKEYNGHHYLVIDTPVTWTEAKLDAESKGGYLVIIKDRDEYNFVASISRDAGRPRGYPEALNWVGAEFYKNMRWQWLDGTSVDSSLWSPKRKARVSSNTVVVIDTREGIKEADKNGRVWYVIEWDE